MNKSLKGALLSGLVLPGLGQIALKHYRRGAVMMIAALISAFVIIMKAVQRALAILENIDLESGAISMSTIADAVSQARTQSESLTFILFPLVLIFCWIISIVDAYRIGRRSDASVHPDTQEEK